AALQLAAEGQHRRVRGERERRAVAVYVLIEPPGRGLDRYRGETRERQAHHERARRVRQRVAQMAEHEPIERGEPALAVLVVRGLDLRADERMAADRALAEDDQIPRQDVRALDR